MSCPFLHTPNQIAEPLLIPCTSLLKHIFHPPSTLPTSSLRLRCTRCLRFNQKQHFVKVPRLWICWSCNQKNSANTRTLRCWKCDYSMYDGGNILNVPDLRMECLDLGVTVVIEWTGGRERAVDGGDKRVLDLGLGPWPRWAHPEESIRGHEQRGSKPAF